MPMVGGTRGNVLPCPDFVSDMACNTRSFLLLVVSHGGVFPTSSTYDARPVSPNETAIGFLSPCPEIDSPRIAGTCVQLVAACDCCDARLVPW